MSPQAPPEDGSETVGTMTAQHPMETAFTRMVGVSYPILQDGMGGGAMGTAPLAAAVSNAGGLGTLSTPGMVGDHSHIEHAMREQIDDALTRTQAPLAVNCPVGVDAEGDLLPGTKALLEAIQGARRADPAAARQLRVIITSAGSTAEFARALRADGMLHFHKVGSPRHAVKAVEQGVDGLIASGFEMGGHTHKVGITTMILAPAVLEVVDVPVLVSGGIREGCGLAAALAAGAQGVAMGTRFLASAENTWHDAYIQRVIDATFEESEVMPGIYGPARFLRSKGTERLREVLTAQEKSEYELSSWKLQHSILAQRDGDTVNGLTTAGLVAGAISDRPPVADILQDMVRTARARLGEVPR